MIDIFIDTREQKPLKFKSDYIRSINKTCLPYGDYACRVDNYRVPVIFERKELGDLFGTLASDHDRFKEEINRATEDKVNLVIIVEKPLNEIIAGHPYSKVEGISIVRTLFTIMIKYKVPFVCCSSRSEMSTYISEFFYSYSKQLRKKPCQK